MTHRERVMAALSHEEPDRVPMDLGGSLVSTIVSEVYPGLRAELNLSVHSGKDSLQYAGLAGIDQDVREALEVDIIHAPRTFGIRNRDTTLLEDSFYDEWGARWHKPKGGHYYIEHAPFEVDATSGVVERHRWPKPQELVHTEGLAEAVRKIRQDTDYAISLELQGRVMSMGQFLRGFESWMMDLAANEVFIEALLERTTKLQIEANDIILNEIGDLVDIVYTLDDLGGQHGPLVSPGCFSRLLKPYSAQIWGHIREKTSAKLMHHCCGSIYPFIGDFVELGVQVLNPVQVSAANMEPSKLKSDFGQDLCFWGGVDTHNVMPNGSKKEVAEEVARRIKQMGQHGGFILAAVHNLQREVPPSNIITLFDTGKKMGCYPLK